MQESAPVPFTLGPSPSRSSGCLGRVQTRLKEVYYGF